MKKITLIKAIKEFFESESGRKVTMAEFKELSTEERNELGRLCAEALGYELEVSS